MMVWANNLGKVVVLLEDLKKQQIAGLVCECCQINDKLALETTQMGFWVVTSWIDHQAQFMNTLLTSMS
jgi:hypothetical protein